MCMICNSLSREGEGGDECKISTSENRTKTDCPVIKNMNAIFLLKDV